MNQTTRFIRSQVTPTLDTDAYSLGDVLGGLLTFSLGNLIQSGFFLNRVVLLDRANQKVAATLYLYSEAPTTIADDAAFALSDANAALLQGIVTLSTYVDHTANATCIVADLNDVYWTQSGNLYGYLVTGGTPTYAAGSLTLSLFISD